MSTAYGVNQRHPATVGPAATVDVDIENIQSMWNISGAAITVINTHPTVDLSYTIERTLDLGAGVDPANDGVFVTDLGSGTISADNGQLVFEPKMTLQALSSTPRIVHRISLSHADGAESVVAQFIISGVAYVNNQTDFLAFG